MVEISEEMIVVKVSTLVRGGEKMPSVFSDEIIDALEVSISNLIGQGKIVEVIRDI